MVKGNKSSNPVKLVLNNKEYNRIVFGKEPFPMRSDKCGDCGATKGKLHKLGCDIERCPNCKGQLATCNCNFSIKSGKLAKVKIK